MTMYNITLLTLVRSLLSKPYDSKETQNNIELLSLYPIGRPVRNSCLITACGMSPFSVI